MIRSLLIGCLLILLGANFAHAHQLGVDSVVLEEEDGYYYRLRYNASPDSREALGVPILPARCQWDEDSQGAPSGSVGLRFSTAGQPLTANDSILLPWKRNGVIVTAVWRDGTQVRQFFMSGPAGIRVELSALRAGSGGLARAAQRYTALGIDHILKGLDHLLFVAGLLLLVKGARRLALTITAFTVAHSVTLALTVVGGWRLPTGPVDAIIALSVVFVAVEIVHVYYGREGLSVRAPWLISFGFGLVHGLGFAGALGALGMPREELPVALLFFNVGVEIGQLVFVGLWLVAMWAGRRIGLRLAARYALVPSYALGVIAMCWFLDRAVRLFA